MMQNTADRIMKEKQRILELWSQKVRQMVPASHAARKAVLMNQIPDFMDNLSINVSVDRDLAHENKSDTSEANREHGKQRANIVEYSLAEVFKEYELLRLTISEVLREDGAIPPEDFDRINQYIDQAVARAGCEFVEIRQTQVEELGADLKRSNEDLERFAAIVAHDVRSPLSTIFSFAGLLDEDLGEKSPAVQKSLGIITANAQRLMILVERLLEYSTISSKQIEFKPVDLNEVIAATMMNLKTLIEDTNTSVICDKLPIINGDAALCIQLFQNLISNSIKFRKQDSTVKIQIDLYEETVSEWRLCVSDDGIGFDSSMKEKIFEPFKTLNTKEYSGSGLGLATCRRVVEMHGGKIWAESEFGLGSKFYFTFAKKIKFSKTNLAVPKQT